MQNGASLTVGCVEVFGCYASDVKKRRREKKKKSRFTAYITLQEYGKKLPDEAHIVNIAVEMRSNEKRFRQTLQIVVKWLQKWGCAGYALEQVNAIEELYSSQAAAWVNLGLGWPVNLYLVELKLLIHGVNCIL